ncbi:MAG: hypothetical protein A2076_03625 [Geobacteraceae bacterium GWC2_53_11]|nr:MAG: hypothetical protein A2076_03625 [Geobacteraceae bacterium GWC2_53_11]
MKKMMTAVALLGLSLPVAAQAMEFQTPGSLGIGRAGVARTTDSYATFINPGGLAFHEKGFSMNLGGGVGVAINATLADNVDKMSKLDTSKLSYDSTGLTAAQSATLAAESTAQAVQALAIIDDVKKNKGELTVSVDAALAFQIRNFGVGVINSTELGAGIGNVDTNNLRTGDTTSAGGATPDAISLANVQQLVLDLNSGVAVPVSADPATPDIANSQSYFSQTQWEAVVQKIKQATGVGVNEAAVLANKVGSQLGAPGTQLAGLTTDQVVSGLSLAADSFSGGALDNNNTTVDLVGISLFEVPIAYGHKFDFGSKGKLGVGAAAKVMRGTVYFQEALLFKDFKDGSSDFTKKVKDSKADSTSFGIDLGALYRLEDVKYIGPVNVGLALKNLNSPKFDGPKDPTTGRTETVKVEPQARLGVGLDPLSWLSIAADMDLTKNKTVLPGRDSQILGGGLEAHFDHWYALWFALRLGAYKNIGESGSKPVITGGFSLGPQYLRFDLNAAVATETGKYDNKSYPNEAKVEFGLSTAFF